MDRRLFLGSLAAAVPPAGSKTIELLDDGGWCWFQDERALVDGGALVFGSVASGYRGTAAPGQVRLCRYELATGKRSVTVLHDPAGDPQPRQWMDDHNAPALWRRPDGKLLTVYSRHGSRNEIHYRVGDQAERVFVPNDRSRVTYSNLFYLSRERRIYNFFRGFDNSFKPSYMWSDDQGETWRTGGVFIDVPSQFRHRPYVKYCSNNIDTIHMAYTEAHPRDFDNSIYHVLYRGGKLHRTDGTAIRSLADGLRRPEEGTRVFEGGPDAVAWTTDFHVTPKGELVLLYTVQVDRAGMDHRFRLAQWDGRRWHDREIAKAGPRLYPGEDDYTGLGAVDPEDPEVVFLSTNVDPGSGRALRFREIYRGDLRRGRWEAVTAESTEDHIRPVVPSWLGGRRAVLWLRGTMRSYTDYSLAVMGMVEGRG